METVYTLSNHAEEAETIFFLFSGGVLIKPYRTVASLLRSDTVRVGGSRGLVTVRHRSRTIANHTNFESNLSQSTVFCRFLQALGPVRQEAASEAGSRAALHEVRRRKGYSRAKRIMLLRGITSDDLGRQI